ncbi:hypothetical protein [Streptomyces blattellae]|uniref:hypothetical protein n=1 Tax=Streptomyces blattellae TaxID=2569855 RepID=UPI001E3A34C7|nr:hypothetical protein [Streptomyces blattellae]
MLEPGEIPQFTGDLAQLETECADLKKDAGDVRRTGQDRPGRAEHHAIPERYPNATREPLDGPANGSGQFDQVWRREDGGFVVVEAKSSVDTELGARNLPDGNRVPQGTSTTASDLHDLRL